MTMFLKRHYNAGGAWCILYFSTIIPYFCIYFPYFFLTSYYYSVTKTRSCKYLLYLHLLRYFPYHHFRLLSSHTISTSTPYQNSPIPNTLPCTHPVSSGAISSLRYSTFLSLYPVKQRTIFLSTIFTLLHHLTVAHYCCAVDKRSSIICRLSIVNCSFVDCYWDFLHSFHLLQYFVDFLYFCSFFEF